MKKILLLGLILCGIVSLSASAQDRGDFSRHRQGRDFHNRELTRFERRRLRHDEFRYHMALRHARRDGHMNRYERKRLAEMRMHERRDHFRYSHNNRRRLI
jgi:hypothetical protein